MYRVDVNIDRYGGTSAASIPAALEEVNRSARLKGGNVVLLDGFGAGFTRGAVIMRWREVDVSGLLVDPARGGGRGLLAY